MKINAFFKERLKAPLHNHVWSWGAVSTSTGNVFLRVGAWALSEYDDGKEWVILYRPGWDDDPSQGAPERLRHIELMKQGRQGYAIIIEFGDDDKIASFDSENLLKLGKPVLENEHYFAEVKARRTIDDVINGAAVPDLLVQDISTLAISAPETERESLVSARIGQGAFRELVLSVWGYRCALSGSRTTSAIRASHIKPWRKCTNKQRLDPHNGLPLLATYDALFDRGLISFTKRGKLICSERLSTNEIAVLGLHELEGLNKVSRQTGQYLEYHRSHVFS